MLSRTPSPAGGPPSSAPPWIPLAGAAATLGLAVAGFMWAKWEPYAHKLSAISSSDAYPGHALFVPAAGSSPSWSAGWDFTVTYMTAIWPALLVALVVASAIQALLPRRWLLALLGGQAGTVRGGLMALPTMMCTCCTAPLTVTLRRSGVPVPAVLAHWLGNPLLNPAVLAFMAILLPWQWVATRVLVGAFLVFVVSGWIARLAGDRGVPAPAPAAPAASLSGGAPAPAAAARPASPGGGIALAAAGVAGGAPPAMAAPVGAAAAPGPGADAPLRFVRAFARLSLTLVPEYLVVVFAVGAFGGWLFPFDGGATSWTALAVLVAAVAGTLIVIPTAGEIPILIGLAAAGAGAALLGTLLIALPAVCLPSLAMVTRALGWRVTALTGVAVASCSVLAGVLLLALT